MGTHIFTKYYTDGPNNFELLICEETELRVRYEDPRLFKPDRESKLLLYCPFCGEKL